MQHDESAAVRRALASLPPRMRAVIVVRYWLQYDVREAAAVLGCSEGTIKSQSKEGLSRLRASLFPAALRPEPHDTGRGSVRT
jgi:RNA polymerase sigma factor (sigma-70 family)